MDAVKEEENMWDTQLPSLEALEAAIQKVTKCAAYTSHYISFKNFQKIKLIFDIVSNKLFL